MNNPIEFYIPNREFVNDARVSLSAIIENPELNGIIYKIADVITDSFRIKDVDTDAYIEVDGSTIIQSGRIAKA